MHRISSNDGDAQLTTRQMKMPRTSARRSGEILASPDLLAIAPSVQRFYIYGMTAPCEAVLVPLNSEGAAYHGFLDQNAHIGSQL